MARIRSKMFREVLDRNLVLGQLERVNTRLGELLDSGDDLALDGEHVTHAELEALRPKFQEALEQGNRGAFLADPAHSPAAYLPRNSIVSNLQSRLHECARRLEEQRTSPSIQSKAGNADTPDLLSVPVPPVTGRSIPPPAPTPLPGERVTEGFAPFEPCDPGWLLIGLALAERKIAGKYPFNATPARAPLGDSARLFLLSDWGTGIKRAQRVSQAVAHRLDQPDSRVRDCHVLHLGDVYYAGWADEQQRHVIDVWPTVWRADGASGVSSWAIPGNHDYYSGGAGFFDCLLRNPLFLRQRSADGKVTSIFELANKHWKVLGLDSGWSDWDLTPSQVQWVTASLQAARSAEPPQLPLLLSHHQPWSAFMPANPSTPLWQTVRPLLEDTRVGAWFWGHEHRLTVYDGTAEIARPRCIGNGGVPEYVTSPQAVKNPSAAFVLDFEAELPDRGDDEHWREFAFAVVDLDGPEFIEAYFDEFGEPIKVATVAPPQI
jgi:hypothetical protein